MTGLLQTCKFGNLSGVGTRPDVGCAARSLFTSHTHALIMTAVAALDPLVGSACRRDPKSLRHCLEVMVRLDSIMYIHMLLYAAVENLMT